MRTMVTALTLAAFALLPSYGSANEEIRAGETGVNQTQPAVPSVQPVSDAELVSSAPSGNVNESLQMSMQRTYEAGAIQIGELVIEPAGPISLIEGGSVTLKAFGIYPDGKKEAMTKDVIWRMASSSADYISIDEKTGKVTALKETVDPVKVTVEYAGTSASVDIKVEKRKITSLALEPSSLLLLLGEEKPLTLKATYNDKKTEKIVSTNVTAINTPKYNNNEFIEITADGKIRVLESALSQGLETALESTSVKGELTFAKDSVTSSPMSIELYKVKDITFDVTEKEIVEGETFTPKATLLYSNDKEAAAKNIEWSSDKPEIATVDKKTGKITAVKPPATDGDKAIITAAYQHVDASGKALGNPVKSKKQITVTVSKRDIKELLATPMSLTVKAPEQKKITLQMVDNTGKKSPVTTGVTWKSSDVTIADVKDGTVTAIPITGSVQPTRRSAMITATYKHAGGTEAKVEILVTVDDVRAIEIKPEIVSLEEGQTNVLTPSYLHTDGTRSVVAKDKLKDITWTSADEKIAKVDANGTVTAIAPGEVQITATYGKNNVVKGTALVKVSSKKPPELQASPSSVSMLIDEAKQVQLTMRGSDGKQVPVERAAWTAADSTILSIDSAGNITPKKAGKTLITAKYPSDGGSTISVPVVIYGVRAIEVGPTMTTLIAGQTGKLTATVVYENGQRKAPPADKTVWKSDQPNVTVQSGEVAAIAAGDAKITASYLAKVSDPVTVSVAAQQVLSLSVASVPPMEEGDSKPIVVTALYNDKKKLAVPFDYWKISPASSAIAEITNGKVVARQAGTQKFTITALGKSVDVYITVNVSAKIISMEIQEPVLALVRGQKPVDLKVSLLYSNGKKTAATDADVEVKSNNPSIVTVNGLEVYGVAEGTATLTVTHKHLPAQVPAQTATVTVSNPGSGNPPGAPSYMIEPASLVVTEGEPQFVKLMQIEADGKKVEVASSDVSWKTAETSPASAIVTVDAYGEVKFNKIGETFITATHIPTGQTVTIPVLTDGISSLEVLPKDISLIEGQSVKLQVNAVYKSGKRVPVTESVEWTVTPSDSANPEVILDTAVGQLSGKIEGEATIQVKYGTKVDEFRVQVVPRYLTNLLLAPEQLYLLPGMKKQLAITALYNDNQRVNVTTNENTSYAIDPAPTNPADPVITVGNEASTKGLVTAHRRLQADEETGIAVKYDGATMKIGSDGSSLAFKEILLPKIFPTAKKVSSTKTWEIQFSMRLNPDSIKGNVKVQTDNGTILSENKVKATVNNNKIILALQDGYTYEPGRYHVIVESGIKSADGKYTLEKPVRRSFIVEK